MLHINLVLLSFLSFGGRVLSYPNALSSFHQKGSFTLDVVRQKREPRDSAQDLLPRARGNLPNEPQAQPATTLFWLAQIEIGNPPQKANVTIDTGSGALWLRGGHDVPQAQVNQYHSIYDPTASKTFVNTSQPFNPFVGDVLGYWATDTVSFAGIVVEKAPVGVAPPVKDNSDADGIMGMSPSHPNGTPKGDHPPWTATLASHLDVPVMVANLRDGDAGTYGFGFIDHTLLDGPIQWNAINNANSAWELDNLWFAIDGKATDASGGMNTVLDTDGVTISADIDIVKAYYATIPGSTDTSQGKGTSWTVPCDTKMPDLQFSVGKGAPNSGVIKGIHLINHKEQKAAAEKRQTSPPRVSSASPDGTTHPTNTTSSGPQPTTNIKQNHQGLIPQCEAYLHAGTGHNFGAPFFQSNLVAFWFPAPPAVPYVGLALQAPAGGNPSAKFAWTNIGKLPKTP